LRIGCLHAHAVLPLRREPVTRQGDRTGKGSTICRRLRFRLICETRPAAREEREKLVMPESKTGAKRQDAARQPASGLSSAESSYPILYLHRTRGEGVEGVHIWEMVRAFQRLGHPVTVLGPKGVTADPLTETTPMTSASNPPSSSGPGLAVRIFRFLSHHAPAWLFELAELAYNAVLAIRLRKLAAARDAGLIYERYAQGVFAGAAFAQRRGVPYVVEVNYSVLTPIVRRRTRLLRPLFAAIERRVLARADVIIVISETLRRLLTSGWRLPAERFLVLPNAADPERFRPDLAPPPALTEKKGDRIVIGYVGGFYRWHGLDALLDAYAALPPSLRRSACLLLIGDGPERAAIAAQARDMGLAEAVILPGMIDHGELPRWLAQFAIAVLPDIADYASPMKLFEYWASGAAVIAADTEPIRDVLPAGEPIVQLIPPADRRALARALKDLMDDPTRRMALGRAARAFIQRERNWLHNAEALLARLRPLKKTPEDQQDAK